MSGEQTGKERLSAGVLALVAEVGEPFLVPDVTPPGASKEPVLRWLAISFAAATLLVTAAPAHALLRPDVVAYWQLLHACEQPSGWHGGFPRYPGGLGILRSNWDTWAGELGLLRRYPTGADAPPLVQIRVADWAWRVWRDYKGRRPGWGCMAVVGRPPG